LPVLWLKCAGIEAMLTDSLTARVEYRYTDYGDENVELFGGLGTDLHVDPSTHTGTIGIAWLFNAI
jgi:outer membrane immunogenic protein